MEPLSLEYLRVLSSQLIFISVFLGGVSAGILGNLITSNKSGKLINVMIFGYAIASTAFIVSVFSMTKTLVMVTPGSPFPKPEVFQSATNPLGVLGFFLGIIALLFMIALSGWLKSKKLGIATSIIALIGFLIVMATIIEVG